MFWTRFGQWIPDPIWAVDTAPNLGSGYWTQFGQWKQDPIWAVDTMLCDTYCELKEDSISSWLGVLLDELRDRV